MARRTRQRRADPGFRLLLLLAAQLASAARSTYNSRNSSSPSIPSSSYSKAIPSADGVVVQQQHLHRHPSRSSSHRPATPARSGAKDQTMSSRPVPSQLDQVSPRFSVQKAGPYHPFGRIRITPLGKRNLRILGESEYRSFNAASDLASHQLSECSTHRALLPGMTGQSS